FVTAGGLTTPEDPDYLRVCSINVLAAFLGVTCGLFAAFNAFVIGLGQTGSIVVLDLFGFACALAVGMYFRLSGNTARAAALGDLACFLTLMAFILQAHGNDYFILWAMVYPPVAFLLHGPRRGALHVGIFAAVLFMAAFPGVGEWSHGHMHAIALSNLVGALLALGIITGVTERNREYVFLRLVRARAELLRISVHDELTGVYNRRYFNEVLARELSRTMRERRHLAFLMLDVDHFKAYNDANGHPAGDRTLLQVAQAISGAFTRAEDLVFRLGGEEFGVLFHVGRPAAAEVMAERVRRRVERLGIPAADGEYPFVTVSGAVTHVSGAGPISADALYKEVDAALYRAKSEGRNRILVCTPREPHSVEPERMPMAARGRSDTPHDS
ncbi:MAG TPA: GGDEF domain-containing protein, partial [Gammaproteobacteria bacterium]|nr:GGDEF domain-containing protein [Gammaproteobacteria bacterium]